MHKKPPFLAQPVLSGDLLGRTAQSLRAALAAAQRIARKHRLTVAVWQELAGANGQGPRVELVRTVEPRRPSSRRRRLRGTQP